MVVSLDSRIDMVTLREFHDSVQRLNRIFVQFQQIVVTALAFIHPDQRIGPVEIANELFQGLVACVNLSCSGYPSVIKSHLCLEIRRNRAFFEKHDRMGMRSEAHPYNGITADLVAVEVGVDQS